MVEKNVGYIVVPPDGGWGWIIVAATFSCNFICDGIMFSFGIFIDAIHDEVGATLGAIARIGSFQSGFYYLFGPFVSAMVNKFGYRIVAFFGGFVSAGAYLGSSYAEDLITMSICNGVVAGIGLSMIYASGTIIVGFYFEKWRALAHGCSSSGSAMGTLVMPPLLSMILDRKGRPYTYRIISALLLSVSVISLLYRPLRPIRVESVYDIKNKKPMWNKVHIKEEFKEEVTKNCWGCCKRKHNQDFPTTDEIVNSDRMQIHEEFIEDDSSDEEIPMNDNQQTAEKLKVNFSPQKKKRCARCCRRFRKLGRPMYRDDILFQHSLMLLPKYRQNVLDRDTPVADTSDDRRKIVQYHMSVTRSHRPKTEGKCQPVLRVIHTMLDVSLLKSPAFQLFIWSGFFTTCGYMIPFFYIKDRGMTKSGMDKSMAVWLISTIGLANMIGRIVCGIIPIFTNMNIVMYLYASLAVAGLVTVISNLKFVERKELQFSYAFLYGWFGASIAAMRPLIVVNLFGLEHLTNALGLQMLCQGVGVICGVLVSGLLLDWTGSFSAAFYMAGCCILFASVLLVFLIPLRNREKRKALLIS